MIRLVRTFVMGAIWFPLLDALHTHFGVLAYTHPAFFMMAWWVPLEFALMWTVVGITVPMLEKVAPAPHPLPTDDSTAFGEIAIFSAIYAFTAIAAPHGAMLTAIVLGAGLALRMAFLSKRSDWMFVVASALLGPIGEHTISSTGAFHYQVAHVGLVPIWLPLLWAHGGFLGRRIFRHRWFAPA